jgi:hypothetical protein
MELKFEIYTNNETSYVNTLKIYVPMDDLYGSIIENKFEHLDDWVELETVNNIVCAVITLDRSSTSIHKMPISDSMIWKDVYIWGDQELRDDEFINMILAGAIKFELEIEDDAPEDYKCEVEYIKSIYETEVDGFEKSIKIMWYGED